MNTAARPAPWRRHPWITLIAALIAAAGLYATVQWLRGPQVRAVTVTATALVQTVVASGRVENAQRVEIGSQLTGTVAEIPVKEGQSVKAGQILVQLETAELRAAVEQARFAVAQAQTRLRQLRVVGLPSAEQNLRQAEAALQDMKLQFRRTKELHDTGYVGRAQLDEAQKNLDIAESQTRNARLQVQDNQSSGNATRLAQMALQQAEAGLRMAQANLDHGTLRAPVSGTLIARNVEPGDVAQPGKVLMVLSPASETQLVVQIDEKNLGLLALGQQALASPDAYPERRFPAELVYINPAVDPQRGAIEVKLRVAAPPDYLRQDMTVSVDIEVRRRPNALTLPVEAVQGLVSAEPWVMKLDGNHARRVPVRIGARAERVEVLEGLAAGDRVIVLNAVQLRDGQRVRALPSDATAAARK